MKAVQVVGYHAKLQLTDIPEPTIEGPLDVIVKIRSEERRVGKECA